MITLRELEISVVDEIEEWAKDNPDKNDIDFDGSLTDIVNEAVPLFSSDLIQLALENVELGTNEPELGPAFDGRPTPVNIIAANVYEHLETLAWEEWAAIQDERRKAAGGLNAK